MHRVLTAIVLVGILPTAPRAGSLVGHGLVSRNSDSSHDSRAGHPGWLRCSSLTYSRYARSSRLAIRAPRSGTYATNHCYGTLAASKRGARAFSGERGSLGLENMDRKLGVAVCGVGWCGRSTS